MEHLWVCVLLLVELINCEYSGTLQSAQIIFRHGQRVAMHYTEFQGEPKLEDKNSEVEHGELTNEGIRQVYQFGKNLRQIYNDFLGEKYVPSKIYAMAGEDNRTIASALGVLAGLFPPKANQIWNNELPWQPIPVHTNWLLDATSFGIFTLCPKLSKLVYESREYEALQNENSELKHLLSKKTGWRVETLNDFNNVVDAIMLRATLLPEKLPKWAQNDTLLEIVKEKRYLANAKLTDIFLPQSGGYQMNLILENMERRINGVPRNFVLLSAHDTNIVTLGRYLKIREIDVLGDFVTNLSFEHHRIDEDDIIKVWYQRNLTTPRIEVELPDCGTPCKMQTLRQLVPRVSKTAFTLACKGKEYFCNEESTT